MSYPVDRALVKAMTNGFGPRKPIAIPGGGYSPSFHGGVDFTPKAKGQRIPVYAVGAGVVYGVNLGNGFAGTNVMIRLDGDGSLWWYAHLSSKGVRKGQRVANGQQLGLMGQSGRATGVHLHLERHWPKVDAETDPWPHIKNEPSPGKTSGPAPTDPTPTPEPTEAEKEEAELMSASADIQNHAQLVANDTIAKLTKVIKAEVDARVAIAESRLRSEIRGYAFYDAGADGTGPYEGTYAAVLIDLPAMYVLNGKQGQIDSMILGGNGADYRWLDSQRPLAPLTTERFWNKVKDSLTAANAPINGRVFSVDEAKAWHAAQVEAQLKSQPAK